MIPRGQFLSGDHNLVNVQAKIDYTVDETKLVDFVEQADRVEGIVSRAAEAVMAEWIASRKVDEILLRGQADLPMYLVHHTQARIEDYRLGIRIHQANISHLLPPPQVKADFDEVTRALPDYTWLTDLTAVAPSAAAAAAAAADTVVAGPPPVTVQMVGRTMDIQGFTRFMRQLEDSPWLKDVTVLSTETIIERGRAVTSFTLRAIYERSRPARAQAAPATGAGGN